MKTFVKNIFLIILFLTISNFSKSQYSDLFDKNEYIYGSDTLRYRLYIPEPIKNVFHFESVLKKNLLLPVENSTKYPIILFLHGSGERGNDNNVQLTYIDSVFAKEKLQSENPCFILAPQCQIDKRWVDVDWDLPNHTTPENPSTPLKLANLLLDSLLQFYPIDKNRIYITGLSMGGYGTWDFISRYPDKFAAAIPICGGGDQNMAAIISGVPIWCFHGAKDKLVPAFRSQNMINAIKAVGGNPIYTEYPDLGHLCWSTAYSTPELFTWLFSQSKK